MDRGFVLPVEFRRQVFWGCILLLGIFPSLYFGLDYVLKLSKFRYLLRMAPKDADCRLLLEPFQGCAYNEHCHQCTDTCGNYSFVYYNWELAFTLLALFFSFVLGISLILPKNVIKIIMTQISVFLAFITITCTIAQQFYLYFNVEHICDAVYYQSAVEKDCYYDSNCPQTLRIEAGIRGFVFVLSYYLVRLIYKHSQSLREEFAPAHIASKMEMAEKLDKWHEENDDSWDEGDLGAILELAPEKSETSRSTKRAA